MDPLASTLATQLTAGIRFVVREATRRGSRPHVDLVSDDGAIVIEVREYLPGVRELHAAITQLALESARPEVHRAVLALWSPRLSGGSTRREWEDLVGLFDRKVRAKLQLVALWSERQLVVPEDSFTLELARALRAATANVAGPRRRIEKRHEILKILVLRWVRNDGPISIKELQSLAGASLPTVSKSLGDLERYLVRGSDRRIELQSFPTQPWGVLTALAPRLRDTTAWMDRSGRPRDLERLVARLARVREPDLALGGVLAARHWDKEFDLEGTPRLDVCAHAPDGALDLGFLARVDPGLSPTDDPAKTVLVVHSLMRPSAQFTPAGSKALPWADPVETLLDLVELRLNKQADELVRHLRRKP